MQLMLWDGRGLQELTLPLPIRRLLPGWIDASEAGADGDGAPASSGCTGVHGHVHRTGGAARLKRALRQAGVQDGPLQWTRAEVLGAAGALVQYGGILSAVAGVMSPQGPGCCDLHGPDRAANLVTTIPYALIGLHGMRERKTPEGRAWGASLVGVAAGSCAFHGSWGRCRPLGRKLDYWLIAASSAMLTRALYPNQPAAVTAASLAATPFRPFLVSTVHTLAMEVAFLRRALRDPALRPAQRMHSAAAAAGMALFFAEDARPHTPFIHAGWHCLSAVATGAIHSLLADAEARQGLGAKALLPEPAGPAAAARGGLVVTPLQVPC